MSEEQTMYEELTYWEMLINRLRTMAVEMLSHEQDGGFVTEQITKLFEDFEELEPLASDYRDLYKIHFHHPTIPRYRLVIEFNARLEWEKNTDPDIPF